MADNLQSQNAIADAYYEYLGTIVSAICITLIIYDYVLTLDRERRYIWPRGLCGPSVLYYSLRYMPISYAIVLPYFLSPPEKSIEFRCKALGNAGMIVTGAGFVSVAVFSSLRAFAISKERRTTLAAIVFLGLLTSILIVPIDSAASLWIPTPTGACAYSSKFPTSHYDILKAFAHSGGVISDMVVLLLTWTRTVPARSEIPLEGPCRPRLTECLFQDGTVYFSAILGIHATCLATMHNVSLDMPMWQLYHASTTVLSCHFILDLHEAAYGQSVSQHASSFDLGAFPNDAIRTPPACIVYSAVLGGHCSMVEEEY